jgi:hypothetical protein
MSQPNPRLWTVAQIESQISALEARLSSVEPRDRAHILDLISGLWGYKFEKVKRAEDIEKCIVLGEQAVDALVPGDISFKGHFLSRRSAWLVTKSVVLLDDTAIDESLRIGEQALLALEIHSSAWWATRVNMGHE